MILYELLTGELPFRGQTRMLLMQVIQDEPRPPRRFNDRIPRDLETICLKAMAKEPARRYQAASGLADDLRRFLKGEPIQARPVGQLERAWRWCRRNPALATTGGLAAVALLAATGIAYQRLGKTEEAHKALERAKSPTPPATGELATELELLRREAEGLLKSHKPPGQK